MSANLFVHTEEKSLSDLHTCYLIRLLSRQQCTAKILRVAQTRLEWKIRRHAENARLAVKEWVMTTTTYTMKLNNWIMHLFLWIQCKRESPLKSNNCERCFKLGKVCRPGIKARHRSRPRSGMSHQITGHNDPHNHAKPAFEPGGPPQVSDSAQHSHRMGSVSTIGGYGAYPMTAFAMGLECTSQTQPLSGLANSSYFLPPQANSDVRP